jgi:aminotransferase
MREPPHGTSCIGFSKAFAMTGFRIGYACGPAAVIDGMLKVHQYGIMCAPIMSEEAAVEALRNGRDSMLHMRDKYRERRDFIVRRFNELGLKCHLPRGAFYAFPDITSTGLDSMTFAQKTARAAEGRHGPGHRLRRGRRRLLPGFVLDQL